MSEYVSICRVISKPEIIKLLINSEYTYLNVKLICSFSIRNAVVFTYISDQFNLYEGEQWFTIHHSFFDISAHGLNLTIKLVDQKGVQVGGCHKMLQADSEQMNQSMIKVTGRISRSTKGGSITIEVAGIAFRIYTRYNDNLQQLEDYITTKVPVYDICIKEEEIHKEKELLKRIEKYPPTDATIEMYALRDLVSDFLVNYNCFRIHGAAFAVDQSGYIFTADSGIGKTTHMRLWLNNLNNAYVVNGDQPIVKIDKDIKICGSPWCGKEGLNNNIDVPLKAIILMERSNENSIFEISMKEALTELIRQVHRPSDSTKMITTLHLVSSLEGKVKFYRYRFDNFAEDAFSISYRKVHLGL